MIYLDTGCLVKLYYPEPQSQRVAAIVQDKPICFTPLHELEFNNALSLKQFLNRATEDQVKTARELIKADLFAGVLMASIGDWAKTFRDAISLSERFTPTIGCRSLDILHCAAAKLLSVPQFVTTDVRQKKLADAMGLTTVNVI